MECSFSVHTTEKNVLKLMFLTFFEHFCELWRCKCADVHVLVIKSSLSSNLGASGF